MKVSSEFSKYASEYTNYNVIQEKVVKKLLEDLDKKPTRILDLGCGSGSVLKAIDWKCEYFLGVDFAQGMIDLHPKSQSIECIYGDFNDEKLFDSMREYKFDYIFSSSALQWSRSIEKVFSSIKSLNIPLSLAIFTSGTFKTLHATAKLESPLKDAISLERLSAEYFDANVEVVKYKLAFDSVREMFRYIKKSGVSGGRNLLSYKETKQLMRDYPLNYLEFEVIFISSH